MKKYIIEAKSDLPYQQRVIDEANDLGLKLSSLDIFFITPFFLTLSAEEQHRMVKQSWIMDLYFEILKERIENF